MTARARIILIALALTALPTAADAAPDGPAETTTQPASRPGVQIDLKQIDSPQAVSGGLKWLALITALSVAPAVMLLVTCFTRIVVVLGLLRQALATQQLPPNQVLFGLALLMTVVVMFPVYQDVHRDAIGPYLDGELTGAAALDAGTTHVRAFMIRQLEASGNGGDVYPFLPDDLAGRDNLTWRDVPTLSLIPGFVISELKIAFTMGFRIFLPFLVIDMLVASVLTSMGILMLPPVLISLPFKLLLFVLADGWHLVVGTLMQSFG
ncbi:MAG: flagellar type III secretion system pore protein FliP [Phycisphaerae bacterium]|nr:flagellar type III secretion system pore protein FliP [Phycisphaerae bacterium]